MAKKEKKKLKVGNETQIAKDSAYTPILLQVFPHRAHAVQYGFLMPLGKGMDWYFVTAAIICRTNAKYYSDILILYISILFLCVTLRPFGESLR